MDLCGTSGIVCGDEEEAVAAYVREIQISHTISAQLRVGNFESDCATQTDITEIWELNELRNLIQTLTQSLGTVKKEVVVQKTLLQGEYEQKIQAHALELYNRMNDTISDVETVHKKKLFTLRKSYQQQLTNALAVIRSSYENHYNGISGTQKSHEMHEADSAKIQTLRRKLDEKDLLIQSLEAQILQMEEMEQPKQIVYQSEDDPEKERLLEENKEMRGEMDALQDRVLQLELVLKQKEKCIHLLDQDVGAMKMRMEEDQRTIEKLSVTQQQLKLELENEKSAAATLLHQQKEEMENVLKSKLKEKEKEKARIQQEQEEMLHGELQRQKEQLILEAEQVKTLKEKAEKLKRINEKASTAKLDIENMNADKENLQAQIKKLLSVREEDLKTIDRLQRELDRLNKTWEKKFEILKQSFHAIKDEMFLRQTLHRQAMNLHKVSVSYMTDGTLGSLPPDLPVRNNFYPLSLPLPQIGAKPPSAIHMNSVDNVDAFEQDKYVENELQVVSDTDEDMEGVPPLPPPPSETIMDNSEQETKYRSLCKV
ncbi:PREDICTED: uncharacterized protein C10orf67 homolog, mitochondrial [Nanorana parkeri]|uniref:uncharacterized protein C10orf67 homolog, mitochondrial n=1 Tax=Nanorana parkeri TaxID=125878 RepID=UPI0008543522|nr:PREDICTED: uncharacterized protein C10orf67 homolog, mitochondrial [Nanorana parkeri]